MKYVKLLLCAAAMFLFLSACAKQSVTTNQNTTNTTVAVNKPIVNNEPVAPTDEFASSRKFYKDLSCVKCHKEDGKGGEVEIDGTKYKAPDFTSDKVKNATDEKLISIITDGDDDMPAFKSKMKPEEIKEMVRFIRKEIQRK